jgi:transposase InsO family protein
MMKAYQGEYAITTMCRALDVSPSGYYAWKKRPVSKRQVADAILLEKIKRIYEASRKLYGSPRVHAVLKNEGLGVSPKRVARLMRQAGLRSQRRMKRRTRTTDSNHQRPVAPNLLERDFNADRPNQKWVGDILGLWTVEGWLYIAALLDTFSRRIIGLSMSAYRDEALVTSALRMAFGQRFTTDETIHHTDRGSQYTAHDYLALLHARDVSVSMSGKADPYDNAMIESFFSTLRAECTDLHTFTNREDARQTVFEFIMVYYNKYRIHSSLDYCSPCDFEAQAIC